MVTTATPWWRSPYLLGYVVLYALLLAAMHRYERFELGEALLVLGIIGVGFSAVAWLLTLRVKPYPFTVKQPAQETALLGAWLVVVAAYLAWGSSWVHNRLPAEPVQSVAILGVKLALFVVVPGLLMKAFWGYGARDYFQPATAWRTQVWPAVGMTAVMVGFQVVFGQGPQVIRQSGLTARTLVPAAPLVFLFLLIEVGLVEEFFFRALLQSRLAALLKSEVAGVVVMSVLFGLAHAPGLYFRPGAMQEAVGTSPSWLMAVGYSIVVTSVAGFFLGVLWARTRNLLLVMVVHAAGDLVPNLAPMVKAWL